MDTHCWAKTSEDELDRFKSILEPLAALPQAAILFGLRAGSYSWDHPFSEAVKDSNLFSGDGYLINIDVNFTCRSLTSPPKEKTRF